MGRVVDRQCVDTRILCMCMCMHMSIQNQLTERSPGTGTAARSWD